MYHSRLSSLHFNYFSCHFFVLLLYSLLFFFFFFNDTATTEIYTLSLHDALPISALAKFFGVPYEPFKPDRIKPMDLLKNLKRDYVESNQWVPIEEAKEGLVIL